MSITRHEVRILAFQTLFALNSNPEADPSEIYTQLIEETSTQPKIPAYLEQLVSGVSNNQVEIDEVIAQYLKKNWAINRLNKTDLLILRLAVYEIKWMPETPDKVALDEALQLAKEFSDDKSRRFINGVLSNLVEKNN